MQEKAISKPSNQGSLQGNLVGSGWRRGGVENLSRVRATRGHGHLSGTAVVRRYQYPFCRIMFMPVRRQRKISELRVTEM